MMNLGDPLPPEIIAAWRRGDKIEAIKRLRMATGVGLAEAKAALEALDGGGPAPSARAAGIPRVDEKTLAPGEMPRHSSQSAVWMVTIVALVLALAAWLYSALT
jgi:hypothetical protein